MVDVIADMCKKRRKTNRRLFTSTRRLYKHVGTFGDIGTFSFFPGKGMCFW